MSEADTKKKLVGRHKRVAFMDVAGDGKTYTRMTGFTSMSESKNASEYSRHYVDEESERTDVVGYAPSNDYEFDRYTNTCVARKRDWSVVPDNSGDGTDALIYKGSLKANGEKIKGTATTTDNWQTCTFAAD